MIFHSKRISQIPPYVFSSINKKKAELKKKGIDVIDLGIGDPDFSTPLHIVNKLKEELDNPANMKYPSYNGIPELRIAISEFYRRQYGVELDAETEVLILIGSKEGLAHLIPAMIDPGEVVLTPDPGYGVYRTAIQLANGVPFTMPLKKELDFKPELNAIPTTVLELAKLMLLNYPGNPTAATVDIAFFQKVVQFAKKYQIPVAHDFAYNMITFDNYEAPSILQAEGAKDIAVEFGSFSKTYNMTGWRIGYVVGNRSMIKALAVVKNNTDTGQFIPIQKAAAFALASEQSFISQNNAIYKERMMKVIELLNDIGIHAHVPRGSFFIWAEVPQGFTSFEFAETLLQEVGVVVTPGTAFGEGGEGYFRISLSVSIERLVEAGERLKSYYRTLSQ
ncbi:LL-diaminopimelate aminotransferase [Bacillus massiliigorillae]|uniref:LL-diaminopimelate aminotransferase n=1 Tax=Bacillus massiliigorillae TaxID=1243664 RepID=UPI0003A5D3F6|nr:LL-diaminopimelate aminotransferase [Bacillus massiliigorillae]